MSEYYAEAAINFRGTDDEENRFRELLRIMNKSEEVEESGVFDDDFPIDLDSSLGDDVLMNALFGKLEDRGEDSGYFTEWFPDFDYTLAPRLFAALFPDAEFTINANWEYEGGGGEYFSRAEYTSGVLRFKDAQTEEDEDLLPDDMKEQYDDGDLSVPDMGEWILDNRKEWKILTPDRNEEYIASFCDGDLDEMLLDTGEES